MRGGTILLVVIGVLVILAGIGMDTTETSRSCYEYQTGYGDSGGCVEYTYSNPVPKALTVMLGFGLVIGGTVYHLRDSPTTNDEPNARISDDIEGESSGQSFADKLEERSK